MSPRIMNAPLAPLAARRLPLTIVVVDVTAGSEATRDDRHRVGRHRPAGQDDHRRLRHRAHQSQLPQLRRAFRGGC